MKIDSPTVKYREEVVGTISIIPDNRCLFLDLG